MSTVAKNVVTNLKFFNQSERQMTILPAPHVENPNLKEFFRLLARELFHRLLAIQAFAVHLVLLLEVKQKAGCFLLN
jgi:hypothetical protein